MKMRPFVLYAVAALSGVSFLSGCSTDPLAGTDRNLASTPPQQQAAAAPAVEVANENNIPVDSVPALPAAVPAPPQKVNTAGADRIARRVQKMLDDGVMTAGGVDRVHGAYIIVQVKLEADERPDEEMRELALAMGKREIAAFLEQEVKSESEMTYTESTVNDKTTIKEHYRSFVQTKTDVLLRGTVLYQLKRKGAQIHAICYVTGKSMNMSDKLREQMQQLPPDTVGSFGFAAIENGRVQAARENAVHAALRNAVEQVLGTAVSSNTQVHDAVQVRTRIFAQSRGFVEHYRIISEGVEDGNYRVELIAKVARNKLLKSYSSYLKQFGDPEFYVRTENLELYQTFVKFFQELGLKVVADESQAAYIIDALGDFRDVQHPAEAGLIGTQLTLWIRIFDANTNQELLSQKNDPRRATEFRMANERNRQKDLAAGRAFRQIKKPLHQALDQMIADMSSNGRNIVVVIGRYKPEYSESLKRISDALTFVVGNDTVTMKIDAEKGIVTFNANYIGQMPDLEQALKLRLRKDYPQGTRIPQTRFMTTNKLNMNF